MDEGLPVAYLVLDEGVPVYAVDGDFVGTVDHIVATVNLDIFHGIVIRVDGTQRFVVAGKVASLHERGVDLSISSVTVAELPLAADAAPAARDRANPSPWTSLVGFMSGKR
ncbi:MAG: PRC-barrel domain-containing protein [Solirubrobacteraceae bacterium]